MKIKTYNKLVRDNIPEIIREGGGECVTEVLSDGDYLRALDSKLSEEMKEYTDSHNIEELADILEVVYAAAGARGITRDALENIRTEKHRKNGGFSKKLFLKEVYEQE
ncbi:MAG: nucleoside triphosphate pyrophosphohydrolase [Oscillospiraceae bacterium]|nr:nucleoside triphosphate pyrophosphohydrolase [Oscillospiraceae bacterium]